MGLEKFDRSEDVTEAFRDLADAFIKALGYSQMRYVSASGVNETIYLRVRGAGTEIGEPQSNAVSDVDAFQRIFREHHASAFAILPRKVAVVLELERTRDAGHGLILYFE